MNIPFVKTLCKRPVGIKVEYINDKGEDINESLTGFEARIFLHHFDYLNGKTILDWDVSEGNIEMSE